jgi:hypothetical protein
LFSHWIYPKTGSRFSVRCCRVCQESGKPDFQKRQKTITSAKERFNLPLSAIEQDMSMKKRLTAMVITTALMLAAQPGYASSDAQSANATPSGVCAKEGVVARCDTSKPLKTLKHRPVKHSKNVKHRGKNIDPITTCSVGKKTPCVPLKK